MSLYEKGAGLFNTHVTWDDVECILHEKYDFKCFGPNKKATRIGEGNGFLSILCRIEPDIQENQSSLPSSMVVKIASQLPQLEYDAENAKTEKSAELFRLVLQNEINLYRLVEKYGSQCEGLPICKVFGYRNLSAENTSKGFIIMEYVDDLYPSHVVDDISDMELDQIIKGLAALSTLTLLITDEERETIMRNMFVAVPSRWYTNELVQDQIKDIRSVSQGTDFEEAALELISVVKSIVCMNEFEKLDKLPQTLGFSPTITHGDLWSTNMLWSRHPNEQNSRLRAFVDFQCCHLGCPALDIISILCCGMGSRRREVFQNYLRKYYTHFEENLTKHNLNTPFSFEQLLISYEILFPFGAWDIICTMAFVQQDIRKRERKERPLPNYDDVQNKLRSIIEDILHYYKKTST